MSRSFGGKRTNAFTMFVQRSQCSEQCNGIAKTFRFDSSEGSIVDEFFLTVSGFNFDICMISTRN